MHTDVELVDALTKKVAERLGQPRADALFKDEYHHRGEHSLEFQAVFLRHALEARSAAAAAPEPRIVPVLCGLGDAQASGPTAAVP